MMDAISAPARSIAVGSGVDAGIAPSKVASPAASADTPVDFGSFLAQMVSDTAHTLKAGEATAVAGINGQASTNEVVQAVMTTEQTLQSAIAIRDKVVAAFLELSRMSI
jgi:flagellar hook-basal body complex protein FliE